MHFVGLVWRNVLSIMHRTINVKWIGHISNRNWLQHSFLKEIFKGREDSEEELGEYI